MMHKSIRNESMYFISFDTHKYFKELEASGFNEKQAEVLVKSLLDSRDYDLSKLATRDQVMAIEKDIEYLKANMSTKAELKEEIANVKYDILKWMIPMFIGVFASTIGTLITILIKLS